jgi:hypothetical protein
MNDAGWAAARRRRASPARVAAAIALHLLVLLALKAAFDRVELRVRGERSTTLVNVALAPLPAPAPAKAPPPAAGRRPPPAPRRTAEHRTAAEQPPQAITLPAPPVVAEAASAPASAPRLVLDPEATRQAIRGVARNPSLSALARSADPAATADERLAQGVAAAQKGDCMKGEYTGGGAGLLSIPFLLAAEAMGKCSSK